MANGLLAPRMRQDAPNRQVNFNTSEGLRDLAAKRRKKRKHFFKVPVLVVSVSGKRA